MQLVQRTFRRFLLLALIGVTGSTCFVNGVRAQDPFAGPMAAPAANAPPADDPLVILQGAGITLRAIRESKPTTALELLQAAESCLNLDAYAESKRYLGLLLQAKPAAADLAKAQAKIGTGTLLRFERQPELQPEARQVMEMVLKAAHAAAANPQQIDALVQQLNAPEPEKRQQALYDLQNIGIDAAEPMLKVISQDSLAKNHSNVQFALVQMFEALRGPILAAMESKKETLRKNVMTVLVEARSREGMYRMLGTSLQENAEGEIARDAVLRIGGAYPTQRDVEVLLDRRIKELLAGSWPEPREMGGLVTVWQWDEAKNAPQRRMMHPEDAALRLASILAADLAATVKDKPDYARTALLARLEWEQRAIGWDKPLPAALLTELQKTSLASLLDMLAVAVKEKQTGAILAALQILAVTGDETLLYGSPGESLVASLLSHTDRRIRLAAMKAIVKWAPKESFAGASRMAEGLAFFLSGTGARKVLVGDVKQQYAQTILGLLADGGYEADAFFDPQDIVHAATTQADYEFVLLSDAIDHPRVPELIQWMRRDYRSEHLLVGVLARADYFDKIERRLRGEYRVAVMHRFHGDQLIPTYDVNAEDVDLAKKAALEEFGTLARAPAMSTTGRMLQLFTRQLERDFVPAEERLEQAFAAADLLTELMAQKSPLRDDLGRIERDFIENMYRPELASRLAPLAAEIASPRVQSALVDLASQQNTSLVIRQGAAQAFARAVEKRGVLLTGPQIERQYARYNASETADAQTQQVLSSLLDVIEARALRSQAKAR